MKVYNVEWNKKVLDNGLTVILVHKPDYQRSLFMLATSAGGFDICQRVNGETVRHRSGCAHYLEHQMFRLDGKDVAEQFAAMQSQTNAFTTYNKTAYYFQTTSDIKEPIRLLMDFVQTLDIDEQSIDKERPIILSERDMYEQSPDHKLLMETWKSLYAEHPVRIDILGTKDDIEQITVEDLTKFYRMNYDPSRLVLVGITGKDCREIMAWIESINNVPSLYASRTIERVIRPESLEPVRSFHELFMDISIPYVCVGYKFASGESKEECLLRDMAVQMRLESLMSALNPDYEKWLEQKIITQISGAECDIQPDHAYLLFYSQTYNVDGFIRLTEQLVETMQTQPINPAIWKSLQVKAISQTIRELDQFENLAVELMDAQMEGYDYFAGAKRIYAVTPEKIQSVIDSLDFSHRTVTTIWPKHAESE